MHAPDPLLWLCEALRGHPDVRSAETAVVGNMDLVHVRLMDGAEVHFTLLLQELGALSLPTIKRGRRFPWDGPLIMQRAYAAECRRLAAALEHAR